MLHKKIVFKDLNGNEISDPVNQVREENKKTYKEKWNAPKKIDYVIFDAESQAGGVELWGDRRTQEDRIVTHKYSNFHLEQFTSEEIKNIFEGVTKVLETCIDSFEFSMNGGSTCNIVIQEGAKYFVSNLGDSTAFTYCLSENAEPACKLINKLHNPSQDEELTRIEKAGGAVFWDRLGGKLALSRSLGDNCLKYHGLSQQPEIYEGQLNKGDVLVVACDGLTEAHRDSETNERVPVLTEKAIREIIKSNHFLPVDELAKKLAQAAYNGNGKFQSEDNISVLVKKIETELSGVNLLAVLDGHGTDNVSYLASILLIPVLQMFMQRALLQQYVNNFREFDRELAEKIETFLTNQLINIEEVSFILKLARAKCNNAKSESITDNNNTLASQSFAGQDASFFALSAFIEGQVSLLERIPNLLAKNLDLVIDYQQSKLMFDALMREFSSDLTDDYRKYCDLAKMILTIRREYNEKVSLSFSDYKEADAEDKRQAFIVKMEKVLVDGFAENQSIEAIMEKMTTLQQQFKDSIKPSFDNSNNSNVVNSSTTFQSINMDKHLLNCIDKSLSEWKVSYQNKFSKAS